MTEKNGKPVNSGQENLLRSKIDYEELRKLISLLEEKNLTQFELEVTGFKIKLSRGTPNSSNPSPVMTPAVITPVPGQMGLVKEEIPGPSVIEDKNLHYVTSPMVGTFYRAPSPSSPPFTEIGDTVKKGQTLCIVEAMKLMNEIDCDVNGVVVDILAENGKAVEYGQKLFAIRVSE
ncbi:MAG: acetyl-CoA carboxylase biotin carboxyl carrier protein [Acidobacteriota bacterium]|nr:acetyl-CoA carboxylase biotin carboxyl carrier protein [Acidobacteriota bacterium]MDW3229029.1 acetyl-CoA carboxylase biotin carboxyl carrier protein [Acidobacteriota bacterium]